MDKTINYEGHDVTVHQTNGGTWCVKQIDEMEWLPHMFTKDVDGCMQEATHYIDWHNEKYGKDKRVTKLWH